MKINFQKILKISFLLIFFVTIIYFGVSFYIAHTLTKIEPKELKINREEISQNSQDVVFESPDGVKLSGWLFNASSQQAIILVHGVEEIRTNEYSNGVELIKELLSKNYNVLVYDTRGNGQSEKTRLTFGQNEGKDIEGAINFLNNKGFENSDIGIIANSMGAISLLQHIDNINTGAIIADSPAVRIEPIIRRELTKSKNIPEFMIPGIYLTANTFFGLDIYSISPIDKVDSRDMFLFFHGEDDDFITPDNSQKLLEKTHSENRLVIFEGSKHVESFKDHPEQYLNEVLGYFEEKLRSN
jgi:hypothetical protein